MKPTDADVEAAHTDYHALITAARQSAHSFDPDTVVTILDPWAEFLIGTACNVTSQTGEDGLIAALFDRIGTRNRWCFEVGAGDGKWWSNTWALREDGWTGVLIEADKDEFAKLFHRRQGRCWAFHERITPDSLDRILSQAESPPNLDLGVIDIDGDDVKVWQGLTQFRPRVILIEFNVAGDGMLCAPYNAWQAGFDTVCAVGREKGYRPLVRTGCNVLFVDEGEIAVNVPLDVLLNTQVDITDPVMFPRRI